MSYQPDFPGSTAEFESDAEREQWLISAPVSEDRVEAFYADYLKSREQCSALETAFRRAEALRSSPEWSEDHAIGFNVLIPKAPFVERSSWALYRGWEFALAAERFLLQKFEARLREVASPGITEPVGPSWSKILTSVDTMMRQVTHGRSNDLVIVLTGPLHENWLLDLTRQNAVNPEWELADELNRTWILATYKNSLILHIGEIERRSLYVVSLPSFGTLIQHGEARLNVDRITKAMADQLLQRESGGNLPERRREMRLKVRMRLYESWEFFFVPDASGSAVSATISEPQ